MKGTLDTENMGTFNSESIAKSSEIDYLKSSAGEGKDLPSLGGNLNNNSENQKNEQECKITSAFNPKKNQMNSRKEFENFEK